MPVKTSFGGPELRRWQNKQQSLCCMHNHPSPCMSVALVLRPRASKKIQSAGPQGVQDSDAHDEESLEFKEGRFR